ncbi:lipase family alpha/beta hydrolase [Alkaliphilus crotonatoxidans]
MKHLKNPIIFIPGLMGSFGGDMLKGQKKWGFGMARLIYDPFIRGLENLGYRRGQNLHICHYDWRRRIEEIVPTYLIPMINEAKKKHPDQSIDIITHSMGGLVARAFIQGSLYQNEVHKLILIGTPNLGALDAYYLWSTGRMVPVKKRSIFQIIYRGYLWILRKILKIPMGESHLSELHRNFPALGQLIPSNGYGPILTYESAPDQWVLVPRSYMRYQNPLLDHLNSQLPILKERVEELYCYCGEGKETNEQLVVDPQQLLNYGKEMITGILKTGQGDGVVTVASASLDKGIGNVLPGSHHGILMEALNPISQGYGVQVVDSYHEEEETLHLLFNGPIEFTLTRGQQTILVYDTDGIKSSYDHMIQEHEGDFHWIAIRNVPYGEYNLYIQGSKIQTINLLVLGREVEKEYTGEASGLGHRPFASFYLEAEK